MNEQKKYELCSCGRNHEEGKPCWHCGKKQEKTLYEIVEKPEDNDLIVEHRYLEILGIINHDKISRLYLREVPSNPWKSFSQEKPDEGQPIELLYRLKGSLNWYITVTEYEIKSISTAKKFDEYWRPFIPPLVEEERDECENFAKLVEKFRDKYRFTQEDRERLEAAWQAVLKSKEKV